MTVENLYGGSHRERVHMAGMLRAGGFKRDDVRTFGRLYGLTPEQAAQALLKSNLTGKEIERRTVGGGVRRHQAAARAIIDEVPVSRLNPELILG